MILGDFQQQLDDLLERARNDHGTAWQVKYLGKKGLFNQLAGKIREVDDKKKAGEALNTLKVQLQTLESKLLQEEQSAPVVDYTLPPATTPRGHLHPVTQAIERIETIFAKIGFMRVRHPELDLDEFAFTRLNMPGDHPARDEWETFFVTHPGKPVKDAPAWVLTPHTSNGEAHELLRLGGEPVRMINISRCYRRQQDVTHTQMFHQFEGMVVDKGINITHLKGVLDFFAQEFYGPGTKSRLRPFHFMFTEPSFEVDFSCQICGGTGQLKTGDKCRFCKSGWHEVGGCGMTHPNVLRAGGYDPDIYTGFAFGWGIERTYTLQKDLHIDDIRDFYNGNLSLLAQF